MKLDLNEVKKYGGLEFFAKQLVTGFITGLHKSPYHGFSVEFAEHRLYNAGESTRYIDWKVFAKTERLYTKVFEEETNLRCQIVIDTSSSMYYPEENNGKITFSILGAASLAYILQKQRDAVGITTFSEDLELQTPCKSTSSHMHTLFTLLENLLNEEKKEKKTSTASVLHKIADKTPKRSLIIIFSDMFDNIDESEALFSAMQHLKHNKHEVVLFHVKDSASEVEFDFKDRPHEFIDLESGEKIKLQPSMVRDEYIKQIKNYNNAIKLKCGQYKIDYIDLDINGDFNQIMLPYLVKRSKLY